MILSAIKKRLEPTLWRWYKSRAPRAKEVTLQHRSIYVLPNRAGLGFFLTMVLLWLLGTNYQNNLVLAICFLLFSLNIISVLHAFRNLSGLCLRAQDSASVSVGESVNLNVLLVAAKNAKHENLQLQLQDGPLVRADLIKKKQQKIMLSTPVLKRGWFQPGPILVTSTYPLGIVRIWSWVHLDTKVLIYPAPLKTTETAIGSGDEDGANTAIIRSLDDFSGFERYQEGAPLTHVAWKLYARGAGLHLKQYHSLQAGGEWLDFNSVSGNVETRLSKLCYWAQLYSQRNTPFGLQLPDLQIKKGHGAEHLVQVLQALALYGLPEQKTA